MNAPDTEPMLERAGRGLAALTAIRGLWSTVGGIALVVIAFAVIDGGAWFVPTLVVGLVLIAAGILGPRVRGRVSLEFGLGGATLDVQLHIAPPGQVGRLPRRGAQASPVPVVESSVEPVIEPAPAPAPAPVVPFSTPSAAHAADVVAAVVAAHRNGNGNGNGAAAAAQPAASERE